MGIENIKNMRENAIKPETIVDRSLKEIHRLSDNIKESKDNFQKNKTVVDYDKVQKSEDSMRAELLKIKSDPAQREQLESNSNFSGEEGLIEGDLEATREWLVANKLTFEELGKIQDTLVKKRDELSKEYTDQRNALTQALDKLIKQDKITQEEYQEALKKTDLGGESTDVIRNLYKLENEIEDITVPNPDLKIDINFDQDSKEISEKMMEIQKKIIANL